MYKIECIDSSNLLYLRASLKASTAYFDTEYGPPKGLILPNTLATFTTRPLAFLMSGRMLRVTPMTP